MATRSGISLLFLRCLAQTSWDEPDFIKSQEHTIQIERIYKCRKEISHALDVDLDIEAK